MLGSRCQITLIYGAQQTYECIMYYIHERPSTIMCMDIDQCNSTLYLYSMVPIIQHERWVQDRSFS